MERENVKGEEISLKEVILNIKEWCQYLISRRILILVAAFLGAGIGFAFVKLKKPVFSAVCTFVLEEAGAAGGMGQYAGLASMVGIDISGGGSNGIFQGENVFVLYKSRLMIEQTLLSPIVINGKESLLIDRYLQVNGVRESWARDPELAKIEFDIPKSSFTTTHDSIIGIIVKDIEKNYLTVEKVDKKLSVISVKVDAIDELFAKEFTNKIVQNVNDFYIRTKTKKSFENVLILQRQADSVKRVLDESIGGAASAIDANPNANAALQILRAPSQRRQIDIQASSAIYAEVVKNLEVSRISLRKETPLIQVIDAPVLPLEEKKVGALTGIVVGAFSLAVLTMVFLLFSRFWVSVFAE